MVVLKLNIFILVVCIYLLFYGIQVTKFINRKKKFEYILEKFEETNKKFPALNGSIYDYDNFNEIEIIRRIILEELSAEMPLINDLLIYNFNSNLTLKKGAMEIIEIFESLSSELYSSYNEFLYQKAKYLSPLAPIREIFLIPSKILSLFGISLTTYSSRVFSLIVYLLVWLFDNYGKTFIAWLIDFIR